MKETASLAKKKFKYPCNLRINDGIDGGGSNLQHFIKAGIDAVEFGPHIINAHNSHERVDLVEMALSAETIYLIAKEISS